MFFLLIVKLIDLGKVINDSLTIFRRILETNEADIQFCHNHLTELLSWTMDPLLDLQEI